MAIEVGNVLEGTVTGITKLLLLREESKKNF